MAIVPTRSSSDTNTSADINTLSTRAVDTNDINAKGDILAGTADNTISRLAVGANDQVLTADSAEATGLKWAAAAGGGGGDWNPNWSAGDFILQNANVPQFEEDNLTNGLQDSLRFDDTTQEFANQYFRAPTDINTSGTVTFRLVGYSVTAAANKNVEFTFDYSAREDTESIDNAFTSLVSGDLPLGGVQDALDFLTWTETVSNLGWVSNDHIRIRLSRTAPSSDNLSGDYRVLYLKIDIPRT